MRKMMITVILLAKVILASSLSLKVIPPQIDSEGETSFLVTLTNSSSDSVTSFARLQVGGFYNTPVTVDSMSVCLPGLSAQTVDMRWSSKIGRYAYKVLVDNIEFKGDFYLFGKKHPVDVVVSEVESKRYHAETMRRAVRYVDSTLQVDIFWSTDIPTVIKYAEYHGAVAVAQSWSTSMDRNSYFKDKALMYFAPLRTNTPNQYCDEWPRRLWDNVIISSACDSIGNRLYCWGEVLEFIDYFPFEKGSSYASCVVAGKFVVLKRKLESYYGRTFSKQEVRQMAQISTGKVHSDSAGFGIIDVDFPFWQYLGQTSRQTGVDRDGSILSQFRLEQNYPNPFNATTTIQYTLSFGGNVRLMVFNIRGEQVVELVNGWQQSGEYTVVWNAGELASGKYILVLLTENGQQTKNMTLLK